MPPSTLDAFRDHGEIRASLTDKLDEAEAVLAEADRLGIDRAAIADRLLSDGLKLFVDAADSLLATVGRKRLAWFGDRIGQQSIALGGDLDQAMAIEQEDWRKTGAIRRLWARDAGLWTGGPEGEWLGWLDIVPRELGDLAHLARFRDSMAADGLKHVVLLGMGGSSLGPEVIGGVFGAGQGYPELLMLDSTDPAQIRSLTERLDLKRSLFIVSSKSGTTLETKIFFQYFYELVRRAVGVDAAPSRFVAVTDPGSELQKLAEREGFRACFLGDKQIGGRYSVLSDFGLVPAAAIGVDVAALLNSAQILVHACGGDVPPAANPAVMLGLALGTAHRHGRDKVTIVTSASLAGFGAWAEQLIAESTGKNGLGLVPIDREPLLPPSHYGQDRIFVSLTLAGDDVVELDQNIGALADAGHPVIRIRIAERIQLGQEFFRWELATAVAGAVIGIDPFDQPDVEASKIKTRELTTQFERDGMLPSEEPIFEDTGITLYADPRNAAELAAASPQQSLAAYLGAHLQRLVPGDYVALLAYLEQSKETEAAIQAIRNRLLLRFGMATSVGFGPRFLHSTGQGYKGGPASGLFLQFTCDHAETLPVPGSTYSFNIVEAAQARGDLQVLVERGRRVLRLHLGQDVAGGLAHLLDLL
jgi:transaldolase/glucose-6-phosphate isomerase